MSLSNDNKGAVLVVEDDRNAAALVSTYLEREGFSIIAVHDGLQALEIASEINPVFVILDLMLPKVDGWEICRTLRKSSDVPILILTAREEEIDRVAGLAMGADDYVVKPFSPRELVERVKAILRRARPVQSKSNVGFFSFGGLELDTNKRTVTRNECQITLTSFEYKMLSVMMNAPGRAFSRDELLNHCHSDGVAVIDRVIDVHIGKLRKKIEFDPSNPSYIQTVRGYGYKFSTESDS